MDVTFSEEHEDLRRTVRQFMEAESNEQVVRELMETERGYDEALWTRMAQELGMDAAEFRFKNFIKPEQFPYESALGWEYDSGDYGAALQKAMDMIGYDELRREQAEKRERGELMGIGISSFVEIVGAGPSKHFDILGLKMFDSCEVRIHPTGKAIARFGTGGPG